MMEFGLKLWAKCRVNLKYGQTIYVENTVDNVKEQIETSEEKVILTVSSWVKDIKLTLNGKDILSYEPMN